MSRRIRTTGALVVATLVLLGGTGAARAQYACAEELGDAAGARPYDNPCPAADDLVLPLPGDLEMVFRRVEVPGQGFWGDPARNIELGDPDARIFEGPRLVSVAGSFVSADGTSWDIVLGKYEVSVAQYAAVIGEGNLREGLQRLVARSSNGRMYARLFEEPVGEAEARRLLASPVRGLRAGELESFTRLYTDWCYRDEVCLSRLPSFGSMPGFFRMPTEIEWEYAARRRSGLAERTSFLPFDKGDTGRYAFVSNGSRVREGPTSIGRLLPTPYGLHDLYGNVAELIDGRFYAELGQGKPGMYGSRGESYAHSLPRGALRPSRRAEVHDYRRDDDGTIVPVRSVRLGMRLAIGSPTVPNRDTLAELEASYADYRSTDRLRSASGQSTRASVLGAVAPLDAIDRLVSEYALKTNLSVAMQEELSRLTEDARVALRRTSETLAYELVQRAAQVAAEAGRSLLVSQRALENAALMETSSSAMAPARRRGFLARARDAEQMFADHVTTYADLVRRLASYRDFASASVALYLDKADGVQIVAAMGLVERHVTQALSGRGDPDEWREDIAGVLADEALFRPEPESR